MAHAKVVSPGQTVTIMGMVAHAKVISPGISPGRTALAFRTAAKSSWRQLITAGPPELTVLDEDGEESTGAA